MRISTALLTACILFWPTSSFAQTGDEGDGYKIIRKEKAGGTGGYDYVYADADGRKLYVPRSAGRGGRSSSRVDVYDLDTLIPAGTISDTEQVHGVAVDPRSGQGFSSSSPVVMFDTKTLATFKTIDVEGRPDGIFYEPFKEQIYVLSHEAPNVTVLDGRDGSIVGTIDLGGAPEQGQSDGAGHAFIDLEDKNEVAVVDTNTMKVTARYALAGKGAPAGLALDRANNILFAYCREPAVCVVLNAGDGKILGTLPTGTGVDGAAFNPGTSEAFSSQGDGTLTVIKENSPTNFEVQQNVKTMPGAKTCALDAKTNRIFLITAEYAPPSARASTQATTGRHRGRGTMLPDSFTILEVGK